MVTRLTFLLLYALALWALPAQAASDFRVEFTKKEVFVGEMVTVNFVVYSELDSVEVEVAKFPEFRGFWKENTVLRQGPIPTTPTMHGRSGALVGSYLLIPILGANEWFVEQMKIVLKNPYQARVEGSRPPEFVLSQGEALQVKPLPALPKGLDAKFFSGAVGKFSFQRPDSVTFVKDEPTLLRVTLYGQGNFQDINELPLEFPEGVEVVSRRSSTQGVFALTNKTFEYNLIVRRGEKFEMNQRTFAFFDPDQRKYVTIDSPPVTFEPQIAVRSEEEEKKTPPSFRPFATSASAATSPLRSGWFWLCQMAAAVGLGAFFWFGLKTRRAAAPKKPTIPLRSRKEMLRELEALYQQKSVSPFLRLADEYATQRLRERLTLQTRLLSRAALLREARQHLAANELQDYETIFQQNERFHYSPDAPSLDLEPLWQRIQSFR